MHLLADFGLLGDGSSIVHRSPFLLDHVTVAIFVQFFVALVHIFTELLPNRRRLLPLPVSNGPIRGANFSFVIVLVVVFNVDVVIFQTLAGLWHRVVHQDVG